MITYDEFGNVTGDTSQPDQTPKGGLVGVPSLDEMKHALAMFGNKTFDMAKQMAQTPFAVKQQMPAALGQAFQLAQVPGEVTLATASSYPAAIAKELGFPKAAKAIQYQPRSPYTYPVLEELSNLPEQITGSSMGFGPIPELMQPEFQRGFTPNDLRVMGAKTTQFGREVGSIPTDFANAQSGIKTLNPLGEETIGTKLQGGVDALGDTLQRRAVQGKSTVPGVPEFVQPQTSMYAVRPRDSSLVKAETGPTTSKDIGRDEGLRQLVEKTPAEARAVINSDPVALNTAYEARYLNNLGYEPGEINDQLLKHKDAQKALEFPELTAPDAIKKAYYYKYATQESQHAKALEQIDSFVRDPANADLVSRHGLPTVDEFKKRLQAGHDVYNKIMPDFINKNIGAIDNVAIALAKKGITLDRPDQILQERSNMSGSEVRRITRNREAAGLSPEGEVQKDIDAKNQELDTLVNHPERTELLRQEQEMRARALAEDRSPFKLPKLDANGVHEHIMDARGVLQPQWVREPVFIALDKQIKAKNKVIDKVNKELQNLKVAKALEDIEDSNFVVKPANTFYEGLDPERRQFYPEIAAKPSTDLVYHLTDTESIGLHKLAHNMYEDALSGKINRTQLQGMGAEGYINKIASDRVAKELREKQEKEEKEKALIAAMLPKIKNVPPEHKYSKASALEVTNAMPYDTIKKSLSDDTYFLDHCVGKCRDITSNILHPHTGLTRQYEALYDPITGEINPLRGQRNNDTSYMRGTRDGDEFNTSFRDNKTGFPVASLRFVNTGPDTFNMGFVSGRKNQKIDPEYHEDIANYLNNAADKIGHSNDNLIDHANIYDLRDRNNINPRGRIKRDLGVDITNTGAQQDLPRFVTRDKLKAYLDANKPVVSARAPTSQTDVAAMQNRLNDIEYEIRNADDDTERLALQAEQQGLQQQLARANNTAGMSNDGWAVVSNGAASPLPSIVDGGHTRRVLNAYRDILGQIAENGGDPFNIEDVYGHLTGWHSQLGNGDPEVMADLGLRQDPDVRELEQLLDTHLRALDQVTQRYQPQPQPQPQPAADTPHTNNISQIIDNAINNFSDVNQPNDVAAFNSALQRAFQAANPITMPEDYIGAIVDEGRALAGTPVGNALQNLAISMNNYHVTYPNARNERSPNYDANRIVGQQQPANAPIRSVNQILDNMTTNDLGPHEIDLTALRNRLGAIAANEEHEGATPQAIAAHLENELRQRYNNVAGHNYAVLGFRNIEQYQRYLAAIRNARDQMAEHANNLLQQQQTTAGNWAAGFEANRPTLNPDRPTEPIQSLVNNDAYSPQSRAAYREFLREVHDIGADAHSLDVISQHLAMSAGLLTDARPDLLNELGLRTTLQANEVYHMLNAHRQAIEDLVAQRANNQNLEPLPHDVNALAERLLDNDRTHTGELNAPSARSTLWALSNGQMDLPEYMHIPPGPERARAMEPLTAAYTAAYQTAQNENANLQQPEIRTIRAGAPIQPTAGFTNIVDTLSRELEMNHEDIWNSLDNTARTLSTLPPDQIIDQLQTEILNTRQSIADNYEDMGYHDAQEANLARLALNSTYHRLQELRQHNQPANQVANANTVPRRVQTASLTQLNGELTAQQQNEVRELADMASTNLVSPGRMRQVAQMARSYTQWQIWEDFNSAQRELLARQLEQHATRIEVQQQQPPAFKAGGHVQFAKTLDQMRFALMKGK